MRKILSIFVGFDGFVDSILEAVDKRFGPGTQYKKIETIKNFSERIAAASQKSTNIELFPIENRIGGNGPILADTLASYGLNVDLLGTLDDPIFKNLHPNVTAIPIGSPGKTNSIEFNDGKLLLGITAPMDVVSLDNLTKVIDIEKFFTHQILCLTNWTMIVHMNQILISILENIDVNKEKLCFFDLADPEKRELDEILKLAAILSNFAKKRYTILGLNLKEAQFIHKALSKSQKSTENIQNLAHEIRLNLCIDEVFIHDLKCSVASNEETDALVEGFYVPHPKITTGAGDHFNAGYLLGKMHNQPLKQTLVTASTLSSYFVKSGQCPPLYF